MDFVEDRILVGHNIHAFDMKFIKRDATRLWGKTVGNDYIDTLAIARQYLPGLAHHRLSDLAVYYGISAEGAHRALADCKMNYHVFEQLGQRNADTADGNKAVSSLQKAFEKEKRKVRVV